MFDATVPAACPVHAAPDHPKVPQQKVGILLANLGTPDNYDYWSMRRYLGEFLSDRRVIDYSPWLWQPLLQLVILTSRPFRSGAAYKSIWNEADDESPLMTITRNQTDKIKTELHKRYGESVMVDFCMRYGNPSTQSKVREMTAAGCSKILFFPLYPHYAGATSAKNTNQAKAKRSATMKIMRTPQSGNTPVREIALSFLLNNSSLKMSCSQLVATSKT